MSGVVRRHLGDVFHELARQKEAKIEKGYMHLDHVHICISIPPRYAVSNVMGYIKGRVRHRLREISWDGGGLHRRELLGGGVLRLYGGT